MATTFIWTSFNIGSEVTSALSTQTRDNIDILKNALVCITDNVDNKTSHNTLHQSTKDSGYDASQNSGFDSNLYSNNCPANNSGYNGTHYGGFDQSLWSTHDSNFYASYLSGHNSAFQQSAKITVETSH